MYYKLWNWSYREQELFQGGIFFLAGKWNLPNQSLSFAASEKKIRKIFGKTNSYWMCDKIQKRMDLDLKIF